MDYELGVSSACLNAMVSTKTIYMTNTNNEGLIPSLFFYPAISCEGGNAREKLNFSTPKCEFFKYVL